MSKLVAKRLIIILLAPIVVWGIIWCCIKAVEPLSIPSGLYEREAVEYSPYLIGKKVQIPLGHFQIGCCPSEYHFGTDAESDELIDLIKRQSHVADVIDLGRWNDGSRRYLITMQALGGVTYLELIDLQKSVDMGEWYHPFRSKHSYAFFDCSVAVKKDEEYYDVLFPQIRRNESGEQLMNGEAEVLKAERYHAIQKPENASYSSLFDFFLRFYEESALYKVLEHTDSEITVIFNQKALERKASPMLLPMKKPSTIA